MHKRRIGIIALAVMGMLVVGCSGETNKVNTTEVKLPGEVVMNVYEYNTIQEVIDSKKNIPTPELTNYLKSVITVMYEEVKDSENPQIDAGLIQILELLRDCSDIYTGPTEDILEYFETKLTNMAKITDPFYKQDLGLKFLEWINNMDLFLKGDYPFILALTANDLILEDKDMEIIYIDYIRKQYNAVLNDKPESVKINIENLKIAGETGIATQMYEQKRFESYFKDTEKHKDKLLKTLYRMGGDTDAR